MTSSGLRFGVVCPAWNCREWVERSLESLRRQTHANFRCVLLDDLSSDDTYDTARRYVAGDERFTILRNETRHFPLGNIVKGQRLLSRELAPEDVLLVLDADDWLKDEGVLAHLAKVYSDPGVWMTYGSCELYNKPWKARLLRRTVRWRAAPYPRRIAQLNLFRYMPGPYLAVHLRSYRRFLWEAVPDAALRDDDGDYFHTCADPATMWPMMELATAAHIRYVPEILYVYNNGHSNSETRPDIAWTDQDQFVTNTKIRSRPALAPLLRSAP